MSVHPSHSACGRVFEFRDPGKLVDGDLSLVLVGKTPADPIRKHVPSYSFEMRHSKTKQVMGDIRLRIAPALAIRFPGHLGFKVMKRYRGHRYAARSCRLLIPLALAHGLKSLWITSDPNNLASQKSALRVGAEYVDTVRVPRDHEMGRRGARYLRRYRIHLGKCSQLVGDKPAA